MTSLFLSIFQQGRNPSSRVLVFIFNELEVDILMGGGM
jgi:hypothetical protein